MIDDPARFPWSSCAALCGQRDDPLLTLHPTQLAMGTSDTDRADAYRDLLTETPEDETVAAIRAYLQQQRAYGRDDFQAMVEARTQRFAALRPAHRPARKPAGPE